MGPRTGYGGDFSLGVTGLYFSRSYVHTVSHVNVFPQRFFSLLPTPENLGIFTLIGMDIIGYLLVKDK